MAEWIEYGSLEPFGPDAAFWRAGLISATIANVNRDTKRKTTPYEPIDFMPIDKKERRKPADPNALKRGLMSLFPKGKSRGKDQLQNKGRKRDASPLKRLGPKGRVPPGR